jgi:hypothetical protein
MEVTVGRLEILVGLAVVGLAVLSLWVVLTTVFVRV